MYLAAEATRNIAWPEVLLAAFEALSFVAVMIWVKLVLYRRRLAEDRETVARRSPHVDVFTAMKNRARIVSGTRPVPLRAAARSRRNRRRSDKSAATSTHMGRPLSSRENPATAPARNPLTLSLLE